MGIFAFMLPFPLHGKINTLIGHTKESLLIRFNDDLGIIIVMLCFFIVTLNVIAVSLRPQWILSNPLFSENLLHGPLSFTSRFCSLPIAMLVVWGTPEMFGVFIKYAEITVINLAPRLFILTLVISITAPLLLDFGFVQFVAVYASPVMRPLFKVPGRTAVDCIASCIGSSSISVIISAKMHHSGYYTDREAAIMVTCFSVTGIYNIYAVTELLGMSYAFTQVLFSVYLTIFLLAAILPRLWPLKNIPDSYHNGMDNYNPPQGDSRHGHTLFEWALIRGISKARHMNAKIYLHESLSIAIPLIFGTIPLMITFGTLLIAIAELTPVMKIIAAPLSWILTSAGIAEAVVIGNSAVFAFIDQYLAVAYAQELVTETARFLCICLTIVGLINLTEIGIHILHSTMQIHFWQLAVIYVMRVVLSLFILIPVTYVFFP